MRKMVLTTVSVIAAMVLTTGCVNHNSNIENKSVETHSTHSEKHSDKQHEAHWGYEGENSPSNWGKMKESFKLCSTGRMQTPINIIPTEDVNIKDLGFKYNTNSTNILNNGHTIQVNIDSGSTINIDGTEYELKQFHFHTPSENNINGNKYELEAHFVHISKDGQIAVVGVMFEKGKSNPTIEKIWEKLPIKIDETKDIKLSTEEIKSIMPDNKDYYKFIGSLTTPPCTENVKWNVFKTPLTISEDQVKKFFDIFGHSNSRPIQETNERIISE